jgi:chaperone required for assembly of F1-ATPase
VTNTDAAQKPRRFYRDVDVAPADQGFVVRLDRRTAKTPRGAPLAAPTEALAGLLAAEWAGQREQIDITGMPATRLAFTAIDRSPEARDGMAEEVARYAGSDLLCYLADDPLALAEREAAVWGPWLSWADQSLGVRLKPVIGISPTTQDPEAIAGVRALAAALDDFELTALVFAAGLYGSAVLALAVQRGVLGGADAFELSRLDEAFQEERWGVDEEAAERTERLRSEAAMIDRWFAALRR